MGLELRDNTLITKLFYSIYLMFFIWKLGIITVFLLWNYIKWTNEWGRNEWMLSLVASTVSCSSWLLFVYYFLKFFKIYLLIMLLQLSHFPPFTPLHPAHPLPPTFPPYSSCQWVIHISSLASTFPTLFLPSPSIFYLPFMLLILSAFPPSLPLPLPCW